MCGVSLEYFGDRNVTDTWLVLYRQATFRCLSVDSATVTAVYRSVLIVRRSGSSDGLFL